MDHERRRSVFPWLGRNHPFFARRVAGTVYLALSSFGDQGTDAVVFSSTDGSTWSIYGSHPACEQDGLMCYAAGLVAHGNRVGLLIEDDDLPGYVTELNYREWTGTAWTAPVHVDAKGEGGSGASFGGQDWFFYVNGDLHAARIGARSLTGHE